MMDFAPDYVTDAPKAIYRIYRDTRFSPDKTPYKTQIAASFSRRGMEKHGAAGYYFAISHKGVDVGGGIYMPTPETLLAVRTHIAERHAEFRQLAASSAIKRLLGASTGQATFARAQGFPRRPSRGGSAALQAIPTVHHAGCGHRHHAEAVYGIGEALPRNGAVPGISECAIGEAAQGVTCGAGTLPARASQARSFGGLRGPPIG